MYKLYTVVCGLGGYHHVTQQSGQPPGGSQHPHCWPPFQLPGARTTCGIIICGIIIWPCTGIGITLDATGGGCA